jgi:hypothetical protein
MAGGVRRVRDLVTRRDAGQRDGDGAHAHWPDAAARAPMALHASRAAAPRAEARRPPRGLLGHRALLPGPTTTPSTVRVGVGVDGAAVRAFGPAFGPQGEGAIEGHMGTTPTTRGLGSTSTAGGASGASRVARGATALSLCLVLRVLVLSFRIW